LDSAGKSVRKYASTDRAEPIDKIAPKHPIPMYWVREERILSAEPGMHRFVWDVRYAAPKSLSPGYPISAIPHDTPLEPQGPWAMPGRYTVKLTVDGRSYTQSLLLKMDPRVKSSAADLTSQFAMQRDAAQGMTESFDALSEIQSTRAQIKSVTGKVSAPDTKVKLADFDKKAAALEGAAVPGFSGIPLTGKQPENFSTLNQRLGRVLAIADAADAAPTTQTEAVAKELETALREEVARWREMKHVDLASLNERLEQDKAGKIDPEVRTGEAPREDADGDDEP
jgi:hypothetical protein